MRCKECNRIKNLGKQIICEQCWKKEKRGERILIIAVGIMFLILASFWLPIKIREWRIRQMGPSCINCGEDKYVRTVCCYGGFCHCGNYDYILEEPSSFDACKFECYNKTFAEVCVGECGYKTCVCIKDSSCVCEWPDQYHQPETIAIEPAALECEDGRTIFCFNETPDENCTC